MRNWARCFLFALILTSAAVAVSAEDPEDDVDRTSFSDPALEEDVVREPEGAHSEVEMVWILPDCPESKVPIGGTSDLLVAMANSGVKTFTMTSIEGKLLGVGGEVKKELGKVKFKDSNKVDANSAQRSFRYPIKLDADMPLGEYTLVATAYYADKDKYPFKQVVVNDKVTLVPALPDKEAQMKLLQTVLLAASGVVILLAAGRAVTGGSGKPPAKAAKAEKTNGKGKEKGNEWLADTLAGTENYGTKKQAKGKPVVMKK